MSKRHALIQLIQADVDGGTVPIGNDGKIVRLGYAQALSISRSAMTHYADVFLSVEDALGTVSRVDDALPKIRNLFWQLLEERTLEVVNEHVSRPQLLGPFGLSGTSTAKRNPRIRELLTWCDTEVARQSYLSPSVRDKINKCRDALLTGCFDDLSTARLNNRSLRLHLGFPGDAAYPDYLREMIEAHEKKIAEGLDKDPLVALINKRPFSIRELISEGWSEPILANLLNHFVEDFSGIRSQILGPTFSALTELLSFLATSDKQCCQEIFRSMNESVRLPDPDRALITMSNALESKLHSASPSAHTVNRLVDVTNSVLKMLARKGLFSSFIKIQRKRTKRSTPRSTVLEVVKRESAARSPEAAADTRLQRLVAFASEKLLMGSADVSAHLLEDGAEAFLETLWSAPGFAGQVG